MTVRPLPTRESYADDLVAAGFSDDGHCLRGRVAWQSADGATIESRVQVSFDDRFPFAPPLVQIVGPDPNVDATFHIERREPETAANLSGFLCLWEADWPVERAPWLSGTALIERVRGWLELTAAGWPNDDSCDLERYLPRSVTLAIYDSDELRDVDRQAVRVEGGPNGTISITSRAAMTVTRKANRPRRKDSGSAWVENIGELSRPLTAWDDVGTVLADLDHVQRAITQRFVRYLLLRYTRAGRAGVLVLRAAYDGSTITVEACEGADHGTSALRLRAGSSASSLRDVSVAVVGCGAIGSFTVDLLYRSGVRELALYDPELLRPGNVVRHLGGLDDVGLMKVAVVRNHLRYIEDDVSEVRPHVLSVRTREQARRLISSHDFVIDATANARATSLLATAANEFADGFGATVLTVCTQRQGTVVRVDRMPLRDDEEFLPALETLPETPVLQDAGCGSPVAVTPPYAVVAAAQLIAELLNNETKQPGSIPATTAEVFTAQPEPTFASVGRVTSREAS